MEKGALARSLFLLSVAMSGCVSQFFYNLLRNRKLHYWTSRVLKPSM